MLFFNARTVRINKNALLNFTRLPPLMLYLNDNVVIKTKFSQFYWNVYTFSTSNLRRKILQPNRYHTYISQYKKYLRTIYKKYPLKNEPSEGCNFECNNLEFLTKPGISNINFKTIENYVRNGRKFTKISARFQLGKKYGNQTFLATYWKPNRGHKITKGSINALVFICHGYGEYLGDAYDEVAKLWCEELGGGSLVFGHDHIGHGRTTAGERVLANDIDELVDPVIAHVKKVQCWNNCGGGKLPVFVVGHSMGGLVSLLALLKDQNLFRGFIGISPLVIISPERATSTNIFLAKHIQRYFPSFTLPSVMDDNDDNYITRDKSYVDSLKNDSLRWHGGPKARMGWLLIKSCEKVQNSMPDITTPLLVLQGGKDKLVEPEGAKMIYSNALSSDKSYVMYPDAFHNLFVELEEVKYDVQLKTLNWMDQRLQ